MGTRLFVGNLSFDATEEALFERFAADGRKVVRVRVMLDRETGRSRGFAFVDMATEVDMRTAIEALDGTSIGGRPMRVSEAMERDAPERGERRPTVDRLRSTGDRPVGRREHDASSNERPRPALDAREPLGEPSERISPGPSDVRGPAPRGAFVGRDDGSRDGNRFGPDRRRGAWREERKDDRGGAGKRGSRRPPTDDDDDVDDDWE